MKRKLEAFIDFCTDPNPLPEWWRFDPGDGCRAGSLTASADFRQGPFTALDPWNGKANVEAGYQPELGGNPVLARVSVTVIPQGFTTVTLVEGEKH